MSLSKRFIAGKENVERVLDMYLAEDKPTATTIVWGAIIRDRTHPCADMHGLVRLVVRVPSDSMAVDVLDMLACWVSRWRGCSDDASLRTHIQHICRSWSHTEHLVTEGTQAIPFACPLAKMYLSPLDYTPYMEPRQ